MRGKWYIASTFRKKEEVEKLAKELEKRGYEVTTKWWKSNLKSINLPLLKWLELQEVNRIFNKNLLGIYNCDYFLILFDDVSELHGAYIELGYAYALKSQKKIKTIIAIGIPNHKSAMYCGVNFWFENIDEFLSSLDRVVMGVENESPE